MSEKEQVLEAEDPGLSTAVWDFFCSIRLTVITLILLAVTSIIGTVIQQNLPPQEYVKLYGDKTFRLFETLGFFDMYHSWWFLALLGLFSVNLMACSVKRIPRVWKTVREPVLVPGEALFRGFANAEELTVPEPLSSVRERLTTAVREKFARPVLTRDGETIYLYAEKGAWTRFGAYVTHLSILVIFLGAIIGNLWGYKAYVNIVEGSAVSEVRPRDGGAPIPLGFTVRADDFDVSYYEGTTRPKEFMSILDVIEDGKEVVANRKIVVNDPLTYKGITFYQSSYGSAGDPAFMVRVKNRETGEVVNLAAHPGEHVLLPGGLSFAVTGYTPGYQQFGPAVQMHVNAPDGRHGNPFIVLQNHPEFDAMRGGPFIFTLLGSEQRYYTGLQVAKDPGVWVVWVGCILLVAGSFAAFFLSHRRVWITLQPAGEWTRVRLGGTAHRNQPAFEMFFDAFKRELKEVFSAKADVGSDHGNRSRAR